MSFVVLDRVKETTISSGTGPITLGGASLGYLPFSLIGDGNSTFYAIAALKTTQWEVGTGTYVAATNTLSRDTVLSSSNANALVNFSSGTKSVVLTQPAERAVYAVGSDIVAANGAILPNSSTTATSANTASAIVARDASGNFAAGTITAALSGNATTANNVTGTVAIANGGTGQTTRQNAMDALAGAVTSGSYLRGNGTDVVMSTIQATDIPTLNQTRIDPRTVTATSTATLTPNIALYDQLNLTAQAVSLTVAAPIGTPVDGNKIIFRILDNGTSRAIAWNATYTVIGTTLPTATTVNKMTYVGCIYNAANTRWDVVAVTTQV